MDIEYQEQEERQRQEYDYESDANSIGEMEFDIDSDDEEQGQDNLSILQNLYQEATSMIQTNTPPTEGWYDERYKYIYKYSKLNWEEMATRFKNKDKLIYDLCTYTKLYIQEILDGYRGEPDFDFNTYYTILCNILRLWEYYSNKYVGYETDTDLMDLAEAMSFLST
jgi:hypothetical protein